MSVTTEVSAEYNAMHRYKSLSDYLNDQFVRETFGIERVQRASSENKGTPLGTFLQLLGWRLEEDRESLVGLMGELGVHRKRRRIISARVAEKVSRLEPKRHLPASRLVELESIHRRISGKLDMWIALQSSVGDRVDDIDFDELIRRAEGQDEALERRRLDVVATALAHVASHDERQTPSGS
jgi:hypothetical protein